MRSEQDFLFSLQRGDQSAWTEYVQIYSRQLYSYLCNYLPSNEDVEDVLSETLLASVSALTRFDGKVTLKTFVFSLAHRKMVDYWRKHKRTEDLEETITYEENHVDILDFRDILGKLPDSYQQVLLLRYHVGMSVSEIADLNKATYKATESLLSRARSQLKMLLLQNSQLQGDEPFGYD